MANKQKKTDKKVEFKTIRSYKLTRYEEMINKEIDELRTNVEQTNVKELWNRFKEIIIETTNNRKTNNIVKR